MSDRGGQSWRLVKPGLLIETSQGEDDGAHDSEQLLTAIGIASVGITTRRNASISSAIWSTALMSFFTLTIIDVSTFCPILVA